VGAVTTHDLTLHRSPDLEVRARAVHFREEVGNGGDGATLVFDHVLRPGLSNTRNAMVLLEAVGLGPVPGQPREDVE
jgi:DNA mismatch repair ATPase MutS